MSAISAEAKYEMVLSQNDCWLQICLVVSISLPLLRSIDSWDIDISRITDYMYRNPKEITKLKVAFGPPKFCWQEVGQEYETKRPDGRAGSHKELFLGFKM